MTMQHLENFINLYNSENLAKRKETWSEENEEGRWRKYSYEDIIARDKTVYSQIKMNFFAQNLREVSANLVKNFDTVFF